MRKILLYIILSLSGIDGAWALPIEKEGMNIYSPSLKQEVSYSIILPEGYEHSDIEYPVLYMFHGIGGDYTSWLEYGNVARVMDKMIKKGEVEPFIMVIPDGYLSYYSDTYDGSFLYETFFIKELVPYIDNNYRTRKNVSARSIIGFSMGGFGALSVSLRNRNLFGSVVALSPSIRTEKQYIEEEPQKEWDSQWGRIFGGAGKNGNQRLTSYYKQHSPYHILSTLRTSDLKGFGIMLDIGDKEGTLCESNEELHRLLLERQIPHEWEVRAGGHDFTCWNGALPKAFRFINKYFNENQTGNNERSLLLNETPFIKMGNATVYYPEPIEAGGKCGVFPYDEITEEYIKGRVNRPVEPINPDPDAVYAQTVTIDLSKLQPVVAFPHLPSNTHYINEIDKDIKIDQVIIGSCTNGRYEDLVAAAEIFKGRKVAPFVRCIVIPGSQDVYDQAMKDGLLDIFIQADCAVSTPTCGPCLGGYMGIMAAGERTVSTTNRNFRGRMGHVDSEVYLASPYVAAASAVLGRIAGPEEV